MAKRPAVGSDKRSEPEQLYQLHVELRDIAPAIWRRLLVPSGITLAKLHHVLQAAMGWTNSHLHQFDIAGTRYGIPDEDYPEITPVDERGVTLAGCLGTSVTAFGYEYDFGDSWAHAIRVERIVPFDDARPYPICIAGANACPPEDVGGTDGYLDFLQAIADSTHPEHANSLRWCGGVFDPAGFDLNSANAAIRQLKITSRR